jgi:hypothetical protein
MPYHMAAQMLNVSYSPSLWEVASSSFRWPETTKPWVVATVLVGAGEDGAHLQTLCTDSALELVGALSTDNCLIASIQCYVIENGCWRRRTVTEVLIGMLGEASVALFRDDQDLTFCPDSPSLPAAQVGSLVSISTCSERLPTHASNAGAPLGRRLHGTLERQVRERQSTRSGMEGSPPAC